MITNSKKAKYLLCLLIIIICCSVFSVSSVGAQKKLSFGLMLRALDIEFFQRIDQGAREACAKRGINLTTQFFGNDANASVQIAQTFIAQGKDGVIFSPLEETTAMVVINKFREAGIPVVIVDNTPYSGMLGSQVSSIISESYRGGFRAGKRLAELLNGKGKIARQTFTFQNDVIRQRDQGFLDAISGYDIEVVETIATDGTRNDTLDKAMGIISKYPDLAGFFCCQGDAAAGVAGAAKSAGREDLIIACYDVTEAVKPYIKSGVLVGVDQFPDEMGRRAVADLCDHIDGKFVPYITLVPVLEVNSKNVDEHKNYKEFLRKYGNGFIPAE